MPGFENAGMRDRSREPHIWEIRGQNQCYLTIPKASEASESDRYRALTGSVHSTSWKGDLLSVIGQHLAAGCGQLRTILLKTRQNDEIALVHQRTAKALDVACTSLLLRRRAAALLLGDGAGRNGYRE